MYSFGSDNATYIDLLVVSIVTDIYISAGYGWQIYLGIMQPIGIGVFTVLGYSSTTGGPSGGGPPALFYVIGVIFKVEDNWTPPEVE